MVLYLRDLMDVRYPVWELGVSCRYSLVSLLAATVARTCIDAVQCHEIDMVCTNVGNRAHLLRPEVDDRCSIWHLAALSI